MLESVYFQNISIDNYAAWKDSFENSQIFQQFLIIYEQYLYRVLSNGPNNYKVNIDLEIFIIESLGKVLRKKFNDIPSLISETVEFGSLVEDRSAFIHIEQPMLNFIPELG